MAETDEPSRSEAPLAHTTHVREAEPIKPPAPRRRHRLGLYLRIALWLFAIAGAIVVATPFVVLRRTSREAAECLALYPKPRGPRLPDCSAGIPRLSKLASYPFMRHEATYRAEELWARIMVSEYENACVGNPDPRVRADTSKFVDDAQTVVERGSQRIQLDDLGPVVSAPHLGKMASSFGDRRTLIEHFDWWANWSVRVHAIQAAFIEGDVSKASEIARRYVDWDPRDPDLRTTMGAALCLGPDPGKGLELLTRVPGDRSDKRYAAIARNYGEVLAVMEACAKKAGTDMPAPPTVTHAGIADVLEARLVEDIRLGKLPALVHEAADKAITELDEERGLDATAPPFARAFLLGAIAAYDDRFGVEKGPLDGAAVAKLSTPADREGPLAPRLSLSLRDVVVEPPGLRPVLSADALARASAKLEALAGHVTPSEGAGSDPREAIRRMASALALHAAIASSRAGDVDAALAHLDEAQRISPAPVRRAALSAATLAYVGGDSKRALDRLVGPEGDEPAVEAGCALVSSLAHASRAERAAARSDLARALTLAEKADDPALTLDARFLELAFSDPVPGGAPPAPVYMGMADPISRWEKGGDAAISRNLDAWKAAFGAPDDDRRAFRYAVMRVRGDAPSFAVPYFVAGSRLLGGDPRSPGMEVWLDALTADDAPRMPLAMYAWSRLEAARIRGDAAAAEVWQKRVNGVRAAKSADADLEIARFLGL